MFKRLFVKETKEATDDTFYCVPELLDKKKERLDELQKIVHEINERIGVLGERRTAFRKLQQSAEVNARSASDQLRTLKRDEGGKKAIEKAEKSYNAYSLKNSFYTELSAQVSDNSDQLKEISKQLKKHIARLEVEIEESESLIAEPERKEKYFKKAHKIDLYYDLIGQFAQRLEEQNLILEIYKELPEFDFDPKREAEYLEAYKEQNG